MCVSSQPEVKCVGKEDIDESRAVRAVVNTNDCVSSTSLSQWWFLFICISIDAHIN